FDGPMPVTFDGGTLDLEFGPSTDISGQIGRSFQLFDWSGVTPNGTFDVVSPYTWDLSLLYTTGAVSLVAVPEPAAFTLVLLGLAVLIAERCTKRLRTNSISRPDSRGGLSEYMPKAPRPAQPQAIARASRGR